MKNKTILCYGDSNTWGYIPIDPSFISKMRYARNERWPGILQELLGNTYHVIEEGLNSRTTNIDYNVPPDRNGKTYLLPCLYSHSPIDLVILSLGGNDAKTYFNRTAHDIKNGLLELIESIQTTNYGENFKVPPKILITSPPIPRGFTEELIDENGIRFLDGAVKKIKELIKLYESIANEKNCFYIDLSEIVPSEIDGIHYDKSAHQACAKIISKKVKTIFEV